MQLELRPADSLRDATLAVHHHELRLVEPAFVREATVARERGPSANRVDLYWTCGRRQGLEGKALSPKSVIWAVIKQMARRGERHRGDILTPVEGSPLAVGEDIDAACGQLAGEVQPRSQRMRLRKASQSARLGKATVNLPVERLQS